MATHVSASSNANSSSGTTLARTGVAVNAGDAIMVFSKWEDGSATDTITDNASGGSNSYTGGTAVNSSGGPYGQIHYAIAKATETLTITQTLSTSRAWRRLLVAVGRPGSGKTFAFDAQKAASGDSSAPSTGSYTVSGGAGYAIATVGEYAGGTFTPGSGWTEAIDDASWLGYRLLTNETSITGNATWTVSDRWVACSAAMKEISASTVSMVPPNPISMFSHLLVR